MQHTDKMGEFYRFLLCLVVALLFLYICHTVITSVEDPSLRGQAFGSLTTMTGMVLGYWFQTSKGSADKDKALANMAQSSQPTTVVGGNSTVVNTPQPQQETKP